MKKRRARVAIIVKQTSWRKFVLEMKDPIIGRLLRRRDPTVSRIKQSHDDHESTMQEVEEALEELGADIVFRGRPQPSIPRADLVLTVGGDGTLLDASHLVGSRAALLGINSAPGSSVGFFCGAVKGSVRATLARALAGELRASTLTRMRVELNGKLIHGRVLNEALFCHASPGATSRYILGASSARTTSEEEQRSSGIWIGPAAGSTAAQRSAGGSVLPLESRRLQFVVREPYTPAGKVYRHSRGIIEPGKALTLRSKMRDGKVFIDGSRIIHSVTLGDVLTMRESDESLTVLGIATKRRR